MPSPDVRDILVTGLTGLAGRALARQPGAADRLVALGGPARLDITDRASVERALASHPGARVLLHLAAYTDTSAAHLQKGDEGGLCYRTNVLGTRYVAEACAARGIHLVHISTDFVFAGDRDEPYTESDTAAPIDWYGRTKWLGEAEARRAGSWTIARLGFPYGPDGRGRDLLGKILTQLRRGAAPLFDDQFTTPTYLGDIAAGLLKLAHVRPANEVFHLVGGEWTTPYDFGMKAAGVFGLDASAIVRTHLRDFVPADGRPRHRSLRLDNRKWRAFAAAHGLAAPVGVEEGLRRTRDAEIKETD